MTDAPSRPYDARRLLLWAGVIGAVLAIPFVAMRFTGEVKWTAFDFLFAGGLMAAVAATYELAARAGDPFFRAGAGLALASGFLLTWITGAVGVIGSEEDPANLMFAGVLGLAVVGATVARFRAGGMAKAMMATGAAQLVVGALALVMGWGQDGHAWPRDILVLSAFFAALWLGSAWFFGKAAKR